MDNIELITLIAISTNWLQMTGVPSWIVWKYKLPSKPIECPLCLGYWAGVIAAIVLKEWGMPIYASFFSALLEKVLNKLIKS